MSMAEEYRHKFIAGLHNALSGHTSEDVDEAVRFSEQSKTKCVGITIETRPDYCLRPHLSQMLRYGCTRLEIGVQSVYEDVARDTNRGHTVRAVSESFHMSKDAGYKIVAHMMPDLPNCGAERDIWQFQEFFENPAFRSDGLKLYPTLVIRGTGLYELWRTGKYKNYPPNALVDIVARIMALVPPWTRVYRVQRDIPMPLVSSGVENGNLRELALARMKDFGAECRDVRYREVGVSLASSIAISSLTCSYTRFIIVSDHKILNFSDETIRPMADGRHSSHTRTLLKISWSVSSGSGNALKKEHSVKSLSACQADAAW